MSKTTTKKTAAPKKPRAKKIVNKDSFSIQINQNLKTVDEIQTIEKTVTINLSIIDMDLMKAKNNLRMIYDSLV